MKLLSFLAFISSILLIGGCDKDDDDTPKTKTELITTSSWKYSAAGVDQNGDGTQDIPLPAGVVDACAIDNTLTFESNGNGTADEGPTKCDASDPQSTPFTWSFKNNETDINFSGVVFTGISGDAKIVELTDVKLTLSKQISLPQIPIPITAIVVLVH